MHRFLYEFHNLIVQDIQIYEKTAKKSLVNIPDVCYNDLHKVEAREYAKVDELVNRLYELQFYGKGSPIAKELLIACLLN